MIQVGVFVSLTTRSPYWHHVDVNTLILDVRGLSSLHGSLVYNNNRKKSLVDKNVYILFYLVSTHTEAEIVKGID
jgi:hypothetical protein